MHNMKKLLSEKTSLLPWSIGISRNKRLQIVALLCSLIFLLLTTFITITDAPKPTRQETEKLPPHLAKIIKTLPPPPKVPKAPPPKLRNIEKEKKKIAKKKKEKVIKKPSKSKPQPKPKAKVAKKLDKASKDEVAKTGIFAFSDRLKKLRDTKIETPQSSTGKVIHKSGTDAPKINRSLLTSRTSSKQVGIDIAELKDDYGQESISYEEEFTIIKAPIDKNVGIKNTKKAKEKYRSAENVKLAFERYKSVLFALYNQRLFNQPNLKGSIVFELDIDKSGKVLRCVILNNKLKDPYLEKQLINKIKRFDFGYNAGIETTTVRFPVNFLPL